MAEKVTVEIGIRGVEAGRPGPLKQETVERIARGVKLMTVSLHDFQHQLIEEIMKTPRQ